MSLNFDQNLKTIVEVVMFENWLRFYFIAESDSGDLMILMPDQAVTKVKEAYPHLSGLAERLNHELITHEKSMREICLFVAGSIDGVSAPESLIQKVLSSPEFQVDLQLFSAWVQIHEEQLDVGFMEFSNWIEIYEEWSKTEKVMDRREKMEESFKTPIVPGSNSVQ